MTTNEILKQAVNERTEVRIKDVAAERMLILLQPAFSSTEC